MVYIERRRGETRVLVVGRHKITSSHSSDRRPAGRSPRGGGSGGWAPTPQ